MDRLNQVSESLSRTQDETNFALTRDHLTQPIIEHARDIFDWIVPFEMEFVVPRNAGQISMSLFFALPPDNCCAGCLCSICEIYTSSDNGYLSTTYAMQDSSVQLIGMNNNDWLTGNETIYLRNIDYSVVDNHTIYAYNIGTISEQFPVKVCYAYQIAGCVCTPSAGTYEIYDNFNRTHASSWQTSSGGFAYAQIGSGTASTTGTTGRITASNGLSKDVSASIPVFGGKRFQVPFVYAFDIKEFVASGGTRCDIQIGVSDSTNTHNIILYLSSPTIPFDTTPYSILITTLSGSWGTNGWYANSTPITSGTVYVRGDEAGVTVYAGSVILNQPWRDNSGNPITASTADYFSDIIFSVLSVGAGSTATLAIDNLRVKDRYTHGSFCS